MGLRTTLQKPVDLNINLQRLILPKKHKMEGSNSYHYLLAIVQMITRSFLKAHTGGSITIYLQQPFINHSSGDFSPMCRENISVKSS